MGEHLIGGAEGGASWKRAYNTIRGLEDGYDSYPAMLGFWSKKEFLEWIKDKTVLDLGSGYGGIARDVNLEEEKSGEKYNTKIISLNPSFVKEGFRKKADDTAADYFTNEGRLPPPTASEHQEAVLNMNDAHNKYAVAGTWDNLPFADNAFDKIMSAYGFPYYEVKNWNKKKGEQKILKVISEIKRVLKPGGEARFYPIDDPSSASSDEKGQVISYLLDIIRGDKSLECRVVIPAQPDSKECIVITKLLSQIKKSDI